MVVTNIVKGDLISKDPNAVKYGLHEVTRYPGPFGRGRRLIEKRKLVKVFGTNWLPNTSVKTGGRRAIPFDSDTIFKKQWSVVSRRGHEAQEPESVTPQFYKESRTLTARRAISHNKSFLKFSVKESRTRDQWPFNEKPGPITWAHCRWRIGGDEPIDKSLQ